MTAIATLMNAWSLQNDTTELLRAFQSWANKHSLYVSCYLPATMQRCFHVMVKRDGKNIAKVKRGLKALAPLCKPFANEHGLADHFYIGVFEHTLSEDGSYHLLIAKDLSRASLFKSFYKRESLEFEGTLDEVLNYVARHHWYGYE
jgi:hypothetical protein